MSSIHILLPLRRLRLGLTIFISVCVLICYSVQIGLCQHGLMVEYYDGIDFDRFVSAGYVDDIDDSWDDVPPVSGMDPNYCSIRWSGKLRPTKTGTYLFAAQVDDGIRVWINEKLVIDQWGLNDFGVFNGSIELLAGTYYDLKVEYFNALREGEIRLLWDIEKANEDKSWYETFFGVEYEYTVITSGYFFRPNRPLPEAIVKEVNPVPAEVIEKKKDAPEPVRKEKKAVPKTAPQVQEAAVPMTIEKAEKYIPKNVQFERGRADILQSSIAELNTFIKFLGDNPEVEVSIEGHTENVGDAVENQKLSERRANRVARFFVVQGISAKRLKTAGYGGTRPLKVPKKGEYYPKNRRVVFILSGLE